MKSFLIINILILLSTLIGMGQNALITLHPDTSDRYVIVYKADTANGLNYNILMGFDTFYHSHKYKNIAEWKDIIYSIDSVITHKIIDTIVLNGNYGLWTHTSDMVMVIDKETKGVIKELLDKGNVRIYDAVNGNYIKQILRKKEDYELDNCYRRARKVWIYRDAVTNKEIYELPIYDRKKAKF